MGQKYGDKEKRLAQEKKDSENAVNQNKEDLRQMLKTNFGRRYLIKRIEKAGVFSVSFTTNAQTTAFNEGMRNNGLLLLDEIASVDPQEVGNLLGEYYARRNKPDDGTK